MRTPDFPPSDIPLKEDVSLLGSLLGEVLSEQGGQELLHTVEVARTSAIKRRRGEPQAEAKLRGALVGLTPHEALPTMRAFSLYFGLVNMAERIHRVRRLREAEWPDQGPPRGSVDAVIDSLAESHVPQSDVMDVLRRLAVVPVFTAHPTEAIRLAILAKEQRLARALESRIERSNPTPPEEATLLARIGEEIRATWQTEEHLEHKEVKDEVEHVIFYLVNVIYRIMPRIHEALEAAVTRNYGTHLAKVADRPFLRFGSWVGGDMDGNPSVGPETIQATLERQRSVILARYVAEVEDLADRITQSPSHVEIWPSITERIDQLTSHLSQDESSDDRTPGGDTPYRQLLKLVARRLRLTQADAQGGYLTPDELTAELQLIYGSLCDNGGAAAGAFRVRRLLRRVQAFGFHLATLDLRQDSEVHREVAGELLGQPGLASASQAERIRLLTHAKPAESPKSHEAKRAVRVMEVIAESRTRFGNEAIGPYIISMTEGPDDALAVLLIARTAGLVDANGNVPLDVVPLFETVDDIKQARSTMLALLEHPDYAAHLAARGGHQMVMLGYSDSAKDSGIASSRWSLIEAQEELAGLQGMHLTVFHGRGGSTSRGGSRPRDAVLAEPPKAVDARLRLTEQGEIIHAKYGLRGIARRTLELTVGAVIEVSAQSKPTPQELNPDWRNAAAGLASVSREVFRDLVHEDPAFPEIFRVATPIDVIERLKIGSRPPSRRGLVGIANLRAIPWVFAWTQTRLMLPGWLGLREGLDSIIDSHGLETVRTMARDWPFFRNLLQDVEMLLAKADSDIALRYFSLGDEKAKALGNRLVTSLAATEETVLNVLGQTELLERQPVLARAIRLRNPYVDPMNFLQIEMLARWRTGQREDEDLARVLFTTVKGIARGLQNTG